MPNAALDVVGLSARYGEAQALRGVSLHVGQGEIVTLVGGGAPDADGPADSPLVIGSFTFHSRLITGTGKYSTYEAMRDCLAASGCEATTVAIRRERLVDKEGRNILDYLDLSRYTILPNTAGCFSAEDAVRHARLALELLTNLGNPGADWVKLECLGDPKTLLPDPVVPAMSPWGPSRRKSIAIGLVADNPMRASSAPRRFCHRPASSSPEGCSSSRSSSSRTLVGISLDAIEADASRSGASAVATAVASSASATSSLIGPRSTPVSISTIRAVRFGAVSIAMRHWPGSPRGSWPIHSAHALEAAAFPRIPAASRRLSWSSSSITISRAGSPASGALLRRA